MGKGETSLLGGLQTVAETLVISVENSQKKPKNTSTM